jgi:hypothetical protein
MKSIVELISELKRMDDLHFADQFGLGSLSVGYHRKLDFDTWLRSYVKPGQQFVDI